MGHVVDHRAQRETSAKIDSAMALGSCHSTQSIVSSITPASVVVLSPGNSPAACAASVQAAISVSRPVRVVRRSPPRSHDGAPPPPDRRSPARSPSLRPSARRCACGGFATLSAGGNGLTGSPFSATRMLRSIARSRCNYVHRLLALPAGVLDRAAHRLGAATSTVWPTCHSRFSEAVTEPAPLPQQHEVGLDVAARLGDDVPRQRQLGLHRRDRVWRSTATAVTGPLRRSPCCCQTSTKSRSTESSTVASPLMTPAPKSAHAWLRGRRAAEPCVTHAAPYRLARAGWRCHSGTPPWWHVTVRLIQTPCASPGARLPMLRALA